MAKNQLTKEECKERFDYDSVLGVLSYRTHKVKSKIGKICRYKHNKGYYRVKIKNKQYMHHVLIWNWHYGIIPDDKLVDHIENVDYSIGANDRIENLRLVTPRVNVIKSKMNKSNKSGYRGVNFYKKSNKWEAKISVNNKQIRLGWYDDILEAARAYNEAAILHHGSEAILNDV